MDRIYKPERKLSIDEAIVLWRGRCIFRQYIKNKRHRYGIQLYELSEPNGIVLRVKIYAGKYNDLSARNRTSNVILALMDGFLNSGYELFMDNYYNSVDLAKNLTMSQLKKSQPQWKFSDETNAKAELFRIKI
uniref:PiggyBac transposable element-derived protein domain-containing protein n=1 Tax=Glossina palpalis gambiensis TaxID=67801 RepID=A0A1B0C2S1_9MUSC